MPNLVIDHSALTLYGVQFPDLETLEYVVEIVEEMWWDDGFVQWPLPIKKKYIECERDWYLGKGKLNYGQVRTERKKVVAEWGGLLQFMIDRKALTLRGVHFPDLATLEAVVKEIEETWETFYELTLPIQNKHIEIVRDYKSGKLTEKQFREAIEKKQD